MTKLKQYSITHYHRGIELDVICVTTSKKKFAELLDISPSYISKYGYSYEPRDTICIENPDVLYAKVGLGGEGRYIFKHDGIKLLSEFETLIGEHRKLYPTRRDYDEAKRNG